MADLSDYLRNAILDHVRGAANLAAITGLWASLHDGDPGRTGANEITAVARKQVVFGNSPSPAGTLTNTIEVVWSNLPALANVTDAFMWDALTGGNPLWRLTMTDRAFQSGNDFRVPVGELKLILS